LQHFQFISNFYVLVKTLLYFTTQSKNDTDSWITTRFLGMHMKSFRIAFSWSKLLTNEDVSAYLLINATLTALYFVTNVSNISASFLHPSGREYFIVLFEEMVFVNSERLKLADFWPTYQIKHVCACFIFCVIFINYEV